MEWGSFSNENIEEQEDAAHLKSLEAFNRADVLIGADIVYDVHMISSLVAVVKSFLTKSQSNKKAIFGITRRNIATFELFLANLIENGIFCEWIAKGEDCDRLPKLFHCKFNQPRSDIQIACLTATQEATTIYKPVQ